MENYAVEGFSLAEVIRKLRDEKKGHPEMLQSERKSILDLLSGAVEGPDKLYLHAKDNCLLPVMVGKRYLRVWCPCGPPPREVVCFDLAGSRNFVNQVAAATKVPAMQW